MVYNDTLACIAKHILGLGIKTDSRTILIRLRTMGSTRTAPLHHAENDWKVIHQRVPSPAPSKALVVLGTKAQRLLFVCQPDERIRVEPN